MTTIKPDFEIYLLKILDTTLNKGYEGMKWYKKLNINIANYDFSNTVVDLIASTSGRFNDSSFKDFGVGRLLSLTDNYTKLKKSLKPDMKRLLVQCSSIGKLKDKFLNDLKRGFLVNEENKMCIIFPSVDYIEKVPFGEELASCLFMDSDTFLQHKYKFKKFNVRNSYENIKTVFHSKFIIACNEEELDDNKLISDNIIMYFGSHNLSASAWGNLEKNNTQVSMANYELGVIFNPIKLRFEEKQRILDHMIVDLNTKYYGIERAWCMDHVGQ
jgi:hypothetical protein